ncbi:hypothetical protein [Botrimarina mediterranea]|uniref:PEP-CTERM protein-sorting domain-containing protein n=1 Tax=Botrimarina mediterranea TaxID=2528022 RepID=A0A518K845_9BACT|nr:hypothetical protein [Botrimarina mediterranea]QDV73955.1 hypothetical protein Spa11_21540 [Botrimarina mediterranea]QDV78585.1 hypothetical protein K2D_21920 [Planctomycetes bacterium K2D]
MKTSVFLNRRLPFGLVMAAVCALAASAGAQTVLFDFGNDASFRGVTTPSPDLNGNYWNSLRTGVFYQELTDISGAATTIDFGFSTGVATDSYNGPAGATDAATVDVDVFFTDIDDVALGDLGAFEAAFDYVAGPSLPTNNQVRFEIQQLDPSKRYELSFFGSHKYSIDATTVYSVYSDNTYSTLVGTVSLDIQDEMDPSLHNRDMVAVLSGLAPQDSNILYVEFVGSNGGDGYLNSMKLVATDAPATAGDFNGDGLVNAADYTVWRDNLNGDEAVLGGAGDGSGTVDSGDYTVWSNNYGVSGSLAVAVPEPLSTSMLIVVLGGCGLTATRRH